MIVQLSTFSKRLNSTARPSGGTSYNCSLKSESGKKQPYLEIATTNNPTAYNYAYIPTYGRYYYITDWIYEGGRWAAYLSVDVLASFKTEIGNTSLYILRSSEEYDNKVLDNNYPAKLGEIIVVSNPATNWALSYDDGSYVLGVVSKAAISGAVAYYVLSFAQMAAFRNAMMNLQSIPDWNTDWSTYFTEFNGEVAKALINPFQYVVSCTWFPFAVSGGAAAPLDFGYWSSGVSAARLASSLRSATISAAVPQNYKGTPEEWRRLNARYAFTCEPFGTIELDPNFAAEATQINANWICDTITGAATMRISDNNGHLYGVLGAQLGVPVQLAQLSTDYAGLAHTALDTVGGGIGSILRGDIAGAVTGAASGIVDAAEKSVPVVNTAGSGGGIGAIRAYAHMETSFQEIVETDNDTFGRPLCKVKTPAELGGFMIAKRGDKVRCAGSDEEKDQIKNYIEGGFYYE